MAMAAGFHLFPFRTEKLSPLSPMVLHTSGRVGSRHFLREFDLCVGLPFFVPVPVCLSSHHICVRVVRVVETHGRASLQERAFLQGHASP